jgi:hypothetical protein
MVNRPREMKAPQIVDTSRMCSADHVRWVVARNPAWEYLTDAELGEKLGLSAGYVGMILSGARPPTKKFLKAIGWEAVTLYQMRRTPRDWGNDDKHKRPSKNAERMDGGI